MLHSSKQSSKICLTQNYVAPYRIPLFNEINNRQQTTVLFCNKNTTGRRWTNEIKGANFSYRFFGHIRVGFFVLNPGLPIYILTHRFDYYLLNDEEENYFSNLCMLIFAKLTRKPAIVWSGHIPTEGNTIHPMDFHHSFLHRWPIKQNSQWLMKKANSLLYRYADAYLAYSDFTKRYLIDNGVDKQKISVGTQAMDTDLLPEVSKPVRLNPKKIQLLYLGYLRPEKGLESLVRAMLKLPKYKFELHIVGDGPEKKSLQRIVGSAKNIKFHEYADAQQRANWYAGVDFMVLPTFFDPWAHTVTESLYYGTPVIVTSSAAASSVIKQDKNGFVYEAGNIKELTRILNSLDHKRIAEMKKFIKNSDNSRLYDVSADAKNFERAIKLAIKAEKK